MASHRRPKQASKARVTVLTTAAAAAVVISGQAANAAPAKPSKSEVKEKVDKLYHDAEIATEKYNGAKEEQGKLQKQVEDLQDKVAREQGELNKLPRPWPWTPSCRLPAWRAALRGTQGPRAS